MSLPIENKISLKERNKISKYKNLKIEIEKKMWYIKLTTVPVLVTTLRMF